MKGEWTAAAWWEHAFGMPCLAGDGTRDCREAEGEFWPDDSQIGSQFESGPQSLPIPPAILAPPSLVQAASLRVQQVGGQLTEQEVIAVLREAGAPEEWIPALVSISWCESKHSPGAIGDGGNSLGQWQLWTGWFRAAGYSVEQAFDPLVNARVAVYVRTVRGRFGGSGGWTCWSGPG